MGLKHDVLQVMIPLMHTYTHAQESAVDGLVRVRERDSQRVRRVTVDEAVAMVTSQCLRA